MYKIFKRTAKTAEQFSSMPPQSMEVDGSPNDDDERLYFPTERCEPSEELDNEYNYDTDNDPLISM